MAKNIGAPAWTPVLKAHIVDQLAVWQPYKVIWLQITDAKFGVGIDGLEPLDPKVHNYDLFRMRCKRIPKNVIAIAHKAYQAEIGESRWAEEKARVQGLSDLIDKVNGIMNTKSFDKDTTGTMAALIGQLRGLYEQIRKEVSADADRAALSASGARVLLANPKNVQLDCDYVSELLLVYREEIGGLHNLDLSSLNIKELEQMRDACMTAIHVKLDEIEEAEIENDNDEPETDD